MIRDFSGVIFEQTNSIILISEAAITRYPFVLITVAISFSWF